MWPDWFSCVALTVQSHRTGGSVQFVAQFIVQSEFSSVQFNSVRFVRAFTRVSAMQQAVKPGMKADLSLSLAFSLSLVLL